MEASYLFAGDAAKSLKRLEIGRIQKTVRVMTMSMHEERIKAHKANIDRYCRLLATHLTELEREYLHNRIMEEHAVLARLEAEFQSASAPPKASPATVIAARSLSSDFDGHSHQ